MIHKFPKQKIEVMMSLVSNRMNGPTSMMVPTNGSNTSRRRAGENNSFLRRRRHVRSSGNENKKQKQLQLNDDAPHNGNLGNPMISILASNHVQVNRLRTVCNLQPFIRSSTLDQMASTFAIRMANRNRVLPLSFLMIDDDDEDADNVSDSDDDSEYDYTERIVPVQMNCHCGESVLDIHRSMVEKKVGYENSLDNILSITYTQMGVGTAVGNDGKLYMCQILK